MIWRAAKKVQFKRRTFTLEFKAELVLHKKAENLNYANCAEKFDVLPKLDKDWEKLYAAGQLTAVADRRAAGLEQDEIDRLRAQNKFEQWRAV